MSSNNKTMGLILTIVGLIVAIIGVVAYVWDTIGLDLLYAGIIIALGVIILVVGILFMYGIIGCATSGEKKGKAPKAASKVSGSGKNRADSVNLGDTNLAKAIKYAAAKIDSKVAAGRMTDAEGDAYLEKVMAYAPQVGKDEDAALVNVSQILGAIAEA